MNKNKLLVSSDHHANWEALEKLFEYAKINKIPFVINGDVIGDYNFEELAKSLDLKFPYEITNEKPNELLTSEEIQSYATYQQIAQAGGRIDLLLKQIP
ncbi:MAG: metallophosphoesterase family protein [Candidatus Woesearchaeota archaeon]|jgi:predicted phosphodiesterase|nr:metallophosphoesterase family protein [Candidatus Woesearchaeota archaeon]